MTKLFISGMITLISLNLHAQHMQDPQSTVIGLFVATDQQAWETVQESFADEVVLDYSSMTGNPAANLSPQDIVTAWKGVLPGFEHTHHQIGNLLGSVDGDRAKVFCYGTATHYLEDENGNVWTVVGSYDFDLQRQEDQSWKISSMTFHFKYQDGNTELPQKAIQNLP